MEQLNASWFSVESMVNNIYKDPIVTLFTFLRFKSGDVEDILVSTLSVTLKRGM